MQQTTTTIARQIGFKGCRKSIESGDELMALDEACLKNKSDGNRHFYTNVSGGQIEN